MRGKVTTAILNTITEEIGLDVAKRKEHNG